MFCCFDTDVAKEVGVPAAVIFSKMCNLHGMYESTGAGFLESEGIGMKIGGKTWMKMSVRALSKEMPCFTQEQVRRALSKLVAHKYLRKENFGRDKMDATNYYTIKYKENPEQ